MDKSKNKSFIVNNGSLLRNYALKNYNVFGEGIIVINLFLLKTNILNASDLGDYESVSDRDLTIYEVRGSRVLLKAMAHGGNPQDRLASLPARGLFDHPVYYIPQTNFWFKILSLKIKEKHQIDITVNNSQDRFLVVFIKDDSIEHFSIYSLHI